MTIPQKNIVFSFIITSVLLIFGGFTFYQYEYTQKNHSQHLSTFTVQPRKTQNRKQMLFPLKIKRMFRIQHSFSQLIMAYTLMIVASHSMTR